MSTTDTTAATQSLRILVVGRGVVPIKIGCGGAELAMYQLSKTFALAGHEATLVADVVEDDFPSAPRLRFVPLESRAQRLAARLPGSFAGWLVRHLVGNLASAARVRSLLRSERFDVIHVHGNLAAILITRFARVPVVYTEHDSTPWSCHYRRWYERVIRRVIYRVINVASFRCVDCVATTCESLRVELLERWRIEAKSVRTILNGADFDVFNPDVSTAGPAPFNSYCLFVGRLTPRKAPDLLLEALVEAPGVNCVFAGDGPMRHKLEALGAELGVDERIAFLGNVSPQVLASLYGNADLLVIPSFSEGTPLVAFEAMACGTPVLSSRIAGLPDVVHDWSTGFLVKPGDVGQLAIAIRFLTADPDSLARMGAEAQRRVRKRFLWPNVAREYLGLYHSLLTDVEDAAAKAAAPETGPAAVAA
jgi:glycosyltransferase involved in cell wall biosynthesis